MDRINTPRASESGARGNSALPTPAISNATRMAGNDNITSHSRISAPSTQPPRKPASRPSTTPMMAEKSTEASPTASDMRAPYIRADRMSRPWSSVPSRNLRLPSADQAGGRRASLRSSVARSKGLCGATQPAKTALNTQASATAAAPTATGELRKLWPTSLSQNRDHAFMRARPPAAWRIRPGWHAVPSPAAGCRR